MRLVTLKLTGYRQFLEPTVLHFPEGLSGICGPNGVGKSKLIEAIGYALYGAASPVLPKGDRVTDIPSRACRAGQASASVELVLEVRGQCYEIVRGKHVASLRLQGATEPLAVGAKAVTMKVIELLHLSPATYYGTFVARQKEVAGLQTLSSDERKRLVNRLIGIEQVEHALNLAGTERKARANQVEIARGSLDKPSAEAIVERDALRRQLDAARREEQACDAAAARAQRENDDAAAAVAEIQKRMEALEGQQHALAMLQANRTALEATLLSAQKRLTLATSAAQELAAARSVLAQTIDARAHLERWDRLAAIEQARSQQDALQRDLTERLAPQQAQREALQRTLTEDDAALETLRAQLGTLEQERARVEQQLRQAKERGDRVEQRLETVRLLGPGGACETCGQVFGDSWENALAHYTEERDTAREEGALAAQQVAALRGQEAALKRHIGEREQVRTDHHEGLQEYDELPGEIASVQREIAEMTALQTAYPRDELAQPYDATEHEAARAAVDKRAEAEADVARLQPISATEPDARKDTEEFERQLRALDWQQRQLEEGLREEARLRDALTRAQDQLVAATTTRDMSAESVREASRQVTRISTQLEAAEQEVERARLREQRVAEAEYALLVAERTDELLNRLLVEITEEARPRLAELLDGWARALLGPRFRQIELADDYRIMADNGSGLHHIAHFSGGEQTLLAVMLRVAIALFCRERAGFDTGFLILDEVFGDQDGDHRAQLVQFLGEVKEHYHQILVINHVEDVTEMLDNIIDVKPTGPNTSTAELRS